MKQIQVKMLGELSLQYEDNRIAESDNRTKKVWLLLSYLICQRDRVVSTKKLVELLWGEEPMSNNPENALRITLHRLRSQLNGLWPNAGRELILSREGGYIWNDAVSVELDCDRFDALVRSRPQAEEQRLQDRLEAIDIYRGDFLEKQSAETWVIPVSTHFHNLYIGAVLEAVEGLMQRSRYAEAVQLCRRAVGMEPYHEQLHQWLMKALVAAGDQAGAAGVYTSLSKRLFDDFGIRPSQETREVYRQSVHAVSQWSIPVDEVLEDLQEPDPAPGAMMCDYDYFKVLCYAQSRDMERSGTVTHVVLLSAAADGEKILSKRSMQRVMHRLGEQIRLNLRKGDIYSRCSASQYIFMLPKANYENSCMVSRRVIGAFQKAHPHVAIKLHYMVQPLSATIRVP